MSSMVVILTYFVTIASIVVIGAIADDAGCDSHRPECCKNGLEMDEALMKCALLHKKKMPKDDSNPIEGIKFLSCLVECIYKSKKYIGKGDHLNKKMVKADIEHTYKDQPKQQAYHIKMYDECGAQATKQWGDIKKNPGAKGLFKGACKPFFMFVFACQIDYGKKVNCPSFKWDAPECKEDHDKCEVDPDAAKDHDQDHDHDHDEGDHE